MGHVAFPRTDAVAYALGQGHVKSAATSPELSYGLGGRLYVSQSGWGLLSVPNALVRGAFDALQEPGIELPPSGPEARLNAHISVFRKEDIEAIGGADNLKERGQIFRYTLGPMRVVAPHGWPGISKCWLIEVHSPELERLRKSYGLTALPKDNKFRFHITVAVRKSGILQANTQSRSS